MILTHDDKALFLKRASNDSHPNTWEFPGGGLEFGESPMDGVAREIEEETGINALFFYPFDVTSEVSEDGLKHTIRIYYKCWILDPNQEVYLSGEHQDYKWVDMSKIN
jgi:8-oxo-dGTP diphosphatase